MVKFEKKSLVMDTITKTNPSSNFGYESPTTDVTPLFAEGVLCGSSKLDILEWEEHPDAL